MASILSRYPRALPLIGGATVIAIGVKMATSRPLLLDSAQNPPTNMLSFPSGMLFSKQLTVTKSEQINHDTKKITFALPAGISQISGVPSGCTYFNSYKYENSPLISSAAAILTQHTPAGGWFPVFRPYTPISDPSERGVLQLLVKQYPKGKASTHLHTLQPGDKLSIRGPLPGYSYTPSTTERDFLFVAGGAGITPIYSLTRGILENKEDKTRIQLLWGVNGMRDLVLQKELEELERKSEGRLRVTYAVSGTDAPATEDQKFKRGYINKSVLQEAIARCEKGSWGDAKGTRVWLCGPPAMETAVAGKQGVLAELGVSGKQVHKF